METVDYTYCWQRTISFGTCIVGGRVVVLVLFYVICKAEGALHPHSLFAALCLARPLILTDCLRLRRWLLLLTPESSISFAGTFEPFEHFPRDHVNSAGGRGSE